MAFKTAYFDASRVGDPRTPWAGNPALRRPEQRQAPYVLMIAVVVFYAVCAVSLLKTPASAESD